MAKTREGQQIEIISKDDQIVTVSLRTLLIRLEALILSSEVPWLTDISSPVFQDVFHYGTSGSAKLSLGAEPNHGVKLPINFTANAIRTFFGILEGRHIHEIAYTDGTDGTNIDCPASLSDALALGDKYDVPFFPNLWKLAMLALTEKEGEYSLLAFCAACSAKDHSLAKTALEHCRGLSNPLQFPTAKIERMGWKTWLHMMRAWDDYRERYAVKGGRSRFDSNYSWGAMSDCLRITEEWNSILLQ